METVAKRLYEGMFLVDSAQAAADWEGTLSFINNILQRADAEVVSMRKWQERKLAYDIDHKTRGTYILCYFNASGERIAGIEKDVLLSEKVMRVLILTTEKRPAAMIEADIKVEPEGKPAEAAAPVPAPAAVPASPAPDAAPVPAAEEATAVAEPGDGPEKAADGPAEQAEAAAPEAEVAPTPEPEKAEAAAPEADVAPTPEPEKAEGAAPEADTEETEKAAE